MKTTTDKRRRRRTRHKAECSVPRRHILPKRGKQNQMFLPFHKRDILAMKPCPDCTKTGILTLNGMFGCTRCRHDFA